MVLGQLIAEKVDEKQISSLLSELKIWVVSNFEPSSIWLFGSCARSQMTTYSDIDVLVLFPNLDDVMRARKSGIFQLSTKIHWPVDLLIMTQAMFEKRSNIGGICQIIKEEGVCIYDSKKRTII